ncbi:MAG: right-handed parallel beta-helix repeat-containing protein, partial [Promethearchaeota archaeon]
MSKNLRNLMILFLLLLSIIIPVQILDGNNKIVRQNNGVLSVKSVDNNPDPSVVHAPILIDGNSQLATFCSGHGSGTYADPYIIENYEIDANSANGIYIGNTNAYLIIRNCTVENGRSNYYGGIYLNNSLNVRIENNSLYNNGEGISLWDSSNNTLSGNTANNNGEGISLWDSSNNTLSGNTVNNNYIGIGLYSSSNNTFSGNTMINDGIIVNDGFNNSIDTSNKVNSKSVRYYENQVGITL